MFILFAYLAVAVTKHQKMSMSLIWRDSFNNVILFGSIHIITN